MVISREQLISNARNLIKAQPKAGRREIASDMRREYGRALRDSEILRLQREIFPKPESLRIKKQRSLERQGFTTREARQYSTLTFKNVPWFDKVRKERAKELKNLRATATLKIAKKQLKDIITDRYADEGWQLENGRIDPWQMFRDLRAQAIKDGKWEETPRPRKGKHGSGKQHGKHNGKLWSKGNIQKQKERYQSRLKARQDISSAYLYGVKRRRK